LESVIGPFGRYRLLDRLGAGGMAEVFRAVLDGPQGLSRTVVLKRILPNLAHDEGFLRLFLDEARISALLHHPAIVQVFDFGAIDGTYFLAMELVEGWTLAQLQQLCKQRLTAVPVADVCYAASELCAALVYAHGLADESGRPLEIVHRDISPSNIMVSKQGGVKLLDFGIARAAEHVRDERTRSGTRKRKLSYMSPEQTSAATVDRRSDIFSLGIVFYEWLTMRRLFKRDGDLETVRAIREEPIVPPSVHHVGIPHELDAVLMRMLARDPRDRYQTCDEILVELVPIVQRLRGHAQTLRAFVGKLEVPASDAAETVPMPKRQPTGVLGEPLSSDETVVAPVVAADRWAERTRPMAQPLAPGVVAFHRRRHWWRRLHPDRRVVLAAGGVVLAVAVGLVCGSVALLGRPHAAPPVRPPQASQPSSVADTVASARADLPSEQPLSPQPLSPQPLSPQPPLAQSPSAQSALLRPASSPRPPSFAAKRAPSRKAPRRRAARPAVR
jgi:serine/threonine protein kinase